MTLAPSQLCATDALGDTPHFSISFTIAFPMTFPVSFGSSISNAF
jgi:hypothetical protein